MPLAFSIGMCYNENALNGVELKTELGNLAMYGTIIGVFGNRNSRMIGGAFMPILYEKIPFQQLLCNQRAYEIIDKAGCAYFENWDMTEFEKAILGMGGTGCIGNEQDHNAVMKALTELDKKMPFLKFGEEGQHYAYELFLSPPDSWGSRGAPFFWAYAARQFTDDKLPMSQELFTKKYKEIVERLRIPFGEDEYVYIEQFAAGGMSSGMVGGLFVEQTLQILCNRLKKYNKWASEMGEWRSTKMYSQSSTQTSY